MNRLDDKHDGLDALMGAYFRAEMPHPWPGPDAGRKTVLPPRKESGWLAWASSSRFSLALSVGVLLMGAWMLAGLANRPDAGAPFRAGPGTAGKGQLPPHPDQKDKADLPESRKLP